MRGLKWLILFLGFVSITPASAEDPCRQIRIACQNSGQKPPMHCVRALVGGDEVAGVKVDAAVVEACRDKKEKKVQKGPVEAPKEGKATPSAESSPRTAL